MADPFDLARFVTAQDRIFDQVLAELRAGQKRSHWMWFIFPQIAGLGHSEMARTYSIGSIAEARAYLDHALLGDRLTTCLATLADLPPMSVEQVFGSVDAAKLRSSLTLFLEAGGGPAFQAALERWFGGIADDRTLELLRRTG